MTYTKIPHLALWKSQNWVLRLYEFVSLTDTPPVFSSNNTQLYNRPAYLFIQSEAPIYTLHIEHVHSRQLKWIHFRKVDTLLVNGHKSPWGGWEGDAILSSQELSSLAPSIWKDIGKLLNCDSIHWTSPPTQYFPNQLKCFKEQVKIKSIETIYLPIDTLPFLNHCKPNEIRKYKKCLRAQMVVKPMAVKKEIYDFIAQCYTERLYRLSITYQILEKLAERFPNHYAGIGVFHHNRLVAAIIYVRVDDAIIYNFLPASLLSYQQMSPIVLLYDYLYSLCQSTGTKYLELGTSQDKDGSYKKSLAQFKLNMGGECTTKLQSVLDIHQSLTSS